MLLLMSMLDSEEDRSKAEIIYRTYRNLLFNVANRILKNETDAEDAVQNAFIRIMENINKISEPECHKTKCWCVLIVKRVALNMIRKRAGEKSECGSELIEKTYEDPGATAQLEAVEEHIDLEAALRELPDRYREVLLLRFHEDLSFQKIAVIMGITEANARQLVSRAYKKLGMKYEGKEE